jgi:hypothetical protein
MAHYALLDENNIVIQVITGKNENEKRDGVTVDWEEWYKDFHDVADCKRTSYNTRANVHSEGGTAFRGNYAGQGMIYDPTNDVFLEEKPFPSWVLNEDTWTYEAPIGMQPDDGKEYDWNETSGAWEEFPS